MNMFFSVIAFLVQSLFKSKDSYWQGYFGYKLNVNLCRSSPSVSIEMKEELVTIADFQNWSVVLLSLENLNIVLFFTE